MGLNEPTRTQKTLNIFKMILYGLKIGLNESAQMCKPINELKRAYMTSNEPSWTQIFIKFLPVMHISVRHDIF